MCGMQPKDFWGCTYREASVFVTNYSFAKRDTLKSAIVLLDTFGDKVLLGDVMRKKPQHVVMQDLFSYLFEEDKKKEKEQSTNEMIRNLRGWNRS